LALALSASVPDETDGLLPHEISCKLHIEYTIMTFENTGSSRIYETNPRTYCYALNMKSIGLNSIGTKNIEIIIYPANVRNENGVLPVST